MIEGIIQSKRLENDLSARRFTEAIHAAQENEDPFSEAPAWRWLARVPLKQAKQNEAETAAAQARTLYRTMGMVHEAAEIERWLDGLAGPTNEMPRPG